MSYREIGIEKRYRLRCQDCTFYHEASSWGMAEETAIGHIRDYVEGHGEPNFGHTVEIAEVTLVGRNV
jgi:hypothetical protein